MSNRPSRSAAGSSKKYADFDFDDSGERKLAELEDSGSDYEDELKKMQESESNVVFKKVIKVTKKVPKKPKVEKPKKVKTPKVKKVLKKPNDDIDYDQLWKCSNCTYENEKDKTECSGCETAKPSKAAEPTPAIAPMASTSHAITGASLFDQETTGLESSLDDETIVITPNRSKKFKKVAQKSKIVILDQSNDENKENTVPSKSGKNLCNDCGELFSRPEHLVTHVKTVHEGKKPYKCEQCEVDCFAKLFSSHVKDLSLHEQDAF